MSESSVEIWGMILLGEKNPLTQHFAGSDPGLSPEIYFWANIKVLLGHLYWDWAIKARTVTLLTKPFWVCVLSAMFLSR